MTECTIKVSGVLFSMLSFAAYAMNAMPYEKYYFTKPIAEMIEGRVMGPNGDYRLIRYEDIAWLNEAISERDCMANAASYPVTNQYTLIRPWIYASRIYNYYDNSAVVSNAVVIESVVGSDYKKAAGITNIIVRIPHVNSLGLIRMSDITNVFSSIRNTSRIAPTTPNFDVIPNLARQEQKEGKDLENWYFSATLTPDNQIVPESFTDNTSDTITNYASTLYVSLREQEKVAGKSAYFPYELWAQSQSGISAPAPDTTESYDKSISMIDKTFMFLFKHIVNTNAWLRGGDAPKCYKKPPAAYIVVSCTAEWNVQYRKYGYLAESDHSYDVVSNNLTNAVAVVKAGDVFFSHVTNGNQIVWMATVSSEDVVDACSDLLGNEFSSEWVEDLSVEAPTAPDVDPRVIGVGVETWANLVGYPMWYIDDYENCRASAYSSNYEKRELSANVIGAFIVIDLELNTSIE